MKKNILVFPCGSEIGLEIYSSVHFSTYFHLIGASSINDHGQFVYDDYISDLPFVTDKDFIPVLKSILKERKIDAIYPTMDLVIAILKDKEEEIDCKVVSSSLETTQICLSKEMTYQKLQGFVRIPKIYNPHFIPIEEFPVFAKPKIGYGAKGTKRLNSQDEVNAFVNGKDDLLIMEYLPGEEYTVDCFTNKEGELLYSAARKRNRIKDGISVNTFFVEEQEEFNVLSRIINEKIHFRGAWFYQVKRDKNGQLSLLEIASRLGGSSLLSRAIGVNSALLTLFDFFDYNVTINKNNYHVVLDRALDNKYKTDLEYDSVYCDYDDCLIIDQHTINVELVRFLYKCINEKKRIYLLSKHEGNLEKELREYRLNYLFDDVIHIGKDDDKVNYIKSSRPIFIDDSYNERYNIKNKLNIPVFSSDMIDVLL